MLHVSACYCPLGQKHSSGTSDTLLLCCERSISVLFHGYICTVCQLNNCINVCSQNKAYFNAQCSSLAHRCLCGVNVISVSIYAMLSDCRLVQGVSVFRI